MPPCMHPIHEIGVVCGTVRKRRGTSLLTLDSKTDFISWPRVNSAAAAPTGHGRTGVMGTAERPDGHFSIISSLLLSTSSSSAASLAVTAAAPPLSSSLRRRCDMMIKEWTDGRTRTWKQSGTAEEKCAIHMDSTDGRTMDDDGVLPMNGIPHGKG